MASVGKKDLIKNQALEIIKAHPEGIRYSELSRQIHEALPEMNVNTIAGSIWDLDMTFPVDDPGFDIRVRPLKHEPDMFYVNKYMKLVEKELWR